MKALSIQLMIAAALACAAPAQITNDNYTNFIRQVQLPDGVVWDASVLSSGQQESALEINPGGARFELHTVRSQPLTSYLLGTRYVGTYVPIAEVKIRTEDINSLTPRTRADRPFYVDVTVDGLRSGASDPEASKRVKFFHHVQSYGDGGTGENLDRTQARLLSWVFIQKNGSQTLSYALSNVPGANRAKIRGEERFSVFSMEDYQAPESEVAADTVQIWPVADGTISGIADGELLKFTVPTLTLAINDIYPEARVYAQVYQGNPQLGTKGAIVPGSAVVINEAIPQNRLLTVSNWDSVITSNGTWTMELLTSTVFGVDRLDHVTFTVDRTISVNGSVTTIE
jgi:hypothetical protein